MTIYINERPTAAQLKNEIKHLKAKKEVQKSVKAAIGILMVSAATAVLICMLWLPIYVIQQGSMEPTLWDGDYVIFMSGREIRRGDIIAFHYNNQTLIKRVIATGGEEVNITSDGIIIIDGEELEEPYVNRRYLDENSIKLPYVVPDEKYFVVGDNRLLSADSRMEVIGAVAQEQISGKAILRVWPFSRIGLLA